MSRLTGFSPKVRHLIKERAGLDGEYVCCEYCGFWQREITLHHRRARGAGGSRRDDTNTASNGVAVCPLDHARIESRRAESLSTGWLVRQTQSPALVPILLGGRFVLLSDDGGIQEVAA